jgi:hypothetical protein
VADTLLTLSDIQPCDLFGNPPGVWYTEYLCQLQGCRTFHWGLWLDPPNSIITETIGKGSTVDLFHYASTYVYRIKAAQNVTESQILYAISQFGLTQYSFSDNLQTAWTFIANYWLPLYITEGPPVPSFLPGWPWNWTTPEDYSLSKPLNSSMNCMEYVVSICKLLGYQILPAGQIVIEKNLENSPYLEYLGIYNAPGQTGE